MDFTADEIWEEAKDAIRAEDWESVKDCKKELKRRSSMRAEDVLDKIKRREKEAQNTFTTGGSWGTSGGSTGGILSASTSPPSGPAPVGPGVLLAGRYEVGRQLGEGGFGFVFEGTDRHGVFPSPLVIKYPKEKYMAQELLHEFQLSQELRHPNICIYHACLDDSVRGRAFLVLQYGGKSISDLLRSGRKFSMLLVQRVARQVGAALSFAHERSILHLDVSPGNILLDGNDFARLTDFGISNRAVIATRTTRYTGTIAAPPLGVHRIWGAPELMLPGGVAHRQTDEWSLAMVLWSMIVGRDFNVRMLFQPLSMLSHRQNESLQRALSDDRKDRFPSVAEFVDEFASAP